MASLDFHFAGGTIRVEGPDPVLIWLEEFLTPQFTVIVGAMPDQTIRLVVDARAYADLLAQGPHRTLDAVDTFTMDGGIRSAARWNVLGDRVVAFDEGAGVFYILPAGGSGTVDAVAAEDPGPARVAVMRIVREFAMMHAARVGWMLVHGAAVQVGDGVVVIAGPKRAGKTTLLVHALLHGGATYVSNDRVAIRFEGDRAFVQGIPTIVSLRDGTAARFSPLRAALAAHDYDFKLPLRACLEARAPAPVDGKAWSLSPRQFCHVLGVPSRAGGSLSAVLFPAIVGRPGPAVLEPLSGEGMRVALKSAAFRAFPVAGLFRIEGLGDVDAQRHAMSLISRVAASAPGFDCHLGADAYAAGASWLAGAFTSGTGSGE